jgi:hypothetical protein
MKSVLFLFTLVLLQSCNSGPKPIVVQNADSTASMVYYGQSIDTSNSRSVNEIILSLKSQDSMSTKVCGYVTGVCQVKGCWMMISQNPNDSTGLFVKFKDYGFFVPKDLTGSKITIAGTAFKSVTDVDELRHYAEDEGKSAEEIAKITEPAEELKFMADGVALLEKSK